MHHCASTLCLRPSFYSLQKRLRVKPVSLSPNDFSSLSLTLPLCNSVVMSFAAALPPSLPLSLPPSVSLPEGSSQLFSVRRGGRPLSERGRAAGGGGGLTRSSVYMQGCVVSVTLPSTCLRRLCHRPSRRTVIIASFGSASAVVSTFTATLHPKPGFHVSNVNELQLNF